MVEKRSSAQKSMPLAGTEVESIHVGLPENCLNLYEYQGMVCLHMDD